MGEIKETIPNKIKSDFKVFCVFSEEDRSFSDAIKQIFQDYLKSNLKQNG